MISNRTKLRAELIEADIKRITIRHNYKNILQRRSSTHETQDYLFFPKSTISPDNTQIRHATSWLFNGFIMKINNVVMAVDPGVNFFLRLTESKYSVAKINKLFISHVHIDHSADANTLMDWLIRTRKKVEVLAPSSVYEAHSISDFHSGRKVPFKAVHRSRTIKNKDVIKEGAVNFSFFHLYHGVECYGFTAQAKKSKFAISYISDTGYAKTLAVKDKVVSVTEIDEETEAKIMSAHTSIKRTINESDVLIVNIDGFLHNKNSPTHLCVEDLVDLVRDTKIKKIVLAHINPVGELAHEEWGDKIAQYVTAATNIETICPGPNGLKIPLNAHQ